MPQVQDVTVLVVDDEPNVRDYLAQILRDAGFKVKTASDGDKALAMIRTQPPDFISLDLVMPRKSGHKLLYELRKDKKLSRIPFVVVTAHATDELGRDDLEDIMQNRIISGPGTYLEKPVRPLDYVRCVQRAVGIEETPDDEERIDLQAELRQELNQADPHALRRALAALKKKAR
ncbi:MAG: response regulator [Gemmatimonadota bacterium]|nr:MAG: response regulator [Gemmatimonadota bacterium]